MIRIISTLPVSTILGFFFIQCADSCNEVMCGSVVTKCLLTESCSCTINNCSCCQHCFACLGDVFDECCSCLGLCPTIDNDWVDLSKTSYVEEITEKFPNLFNALTELPDPLERWSIVSYPLEIDMSLLAPKSIVALHMQSQNDSRVPYNRQVEIINCTVAYMSNCISLDKCKNSCKSMGASSFRWFHDSCCECVGDTCINYGLNESKCKRCGKNTNKDYEPSEEDVDYGQDYDSNDMYDEYIN